MMGVILLLIIIFLLLLLFAAGFRGHHYWKYNWWFGLVVSGFEPLILVEGI